MITASVLVNNSAAMRDGEDSGDRHAVFRRDAKLQVLSKGGHESPEPAWGLWGQAVAAACDCHQAEKLLKQFLGISVFVLQLLTIGAANLALDGILMKAAINRFDRRPQVEPMENVRVILAKPGRLARFIRDWPYLEALVSTGVNLLPRVP